MLSVKNHKLGYSIIINNSVKPRHLVSANFNFFLAPFSLNSSRTNRVHVWEHFLSENRKPPNILGCCFRITLGSKLAITNMVYPQLRFCSKLGTRLHTKSPESLFLYRISGVLTLPWSEPPSSMCLEDSLGKVTRKNLTKKRAAMG